jgi:hypothetical protein
MARGSQPAKPRSGEPLPEDLGHPRGTLFIVFLFGLLFGVGWFVMFISMFLHRGGLHH